jgi:hypothetical protein
VTAEHLAGGVITVEDRAELGVDELLQGSSVPGELRAPAFERAQHAPGVVQHELAR